MAYPWRREDAGRFGLLILALLLLSAVAMPGLALRWEVPLPADLLYLFHPWSGDAPEGFQEASNPLHSDVTSAIYPWHCLVARIYRSGWIPLWNPDNLAGTPLLANGQSAALDPLSLLLLPLPTLVGWRLLLPLKHLLAGAGMALLLRRRMRSWTAVWVGASAYAFSGYMVCWLGWRHSTVAAFLPWIAWGLDLVLERPTSRRVSLLAILVGAAVLGGHVETAMHGLYAVFFLLLWHALTQRRGRVALPALCALILGLLLGAAQLLPLAEYATRSRLLLVRREMGAGGILPIWAALTWLVPNLLGNPSKGDYVRHLTLNYNEQTGYVGIAVLCLAPLALASRRHRREALGLLALALAALGLPYDLPGLRRLAHLPGLGEAANTRTLYVAGFALCWLAALGADALGHRPLRGRWLLLSAGLPALGTGILAWLFLPGRPEAIPWILLAAGGAGLLALGGWLLARGALPLPLAGALLAAAVAGDLALFAQGYNPTLPAERAFPPVESIAALRQRAPDAPMVAQGWSFTPNANLVYGMADLRMHDPLSDRRWHDVFQEAELTSHFDGRGTYLLLEEPSASHLAMAGVRLLLAPAWWHPRGTGESGPGPLRSVWSQGDAALWEVPGARPKVYLASEIDLASPAEALEAWADPAFVTGRGALLEDGWDALAGNAPAPPVWRRTAPGRLEVDLEVPRRRLLVVQESYDPGWSALLDGEEIPIHRANYVFQAVEVPPGRHHLLLRYVPDSFRLGLLGSLLGCLAAAALLLRKPSEPGLDPQGR